MPTTRRSTGGTRARPGPTKGQSTISFASSVTKAIPKDVKANVISAPIRTKVEVSEPVVKDIVEDEEQSEEEAEDEDEEEPVVELAPEKSKEEALAEDITDAQVNKYWKTIENERKAPRVHQEGLSTNEKLLRYFDVSSQYGVNPIGLVLIQRNVSLTSSLALHWYSTKEALGASTPPRAQPPTRSPGRTTEGGIQGQ